MPKKWSPGMPLPDWRGDNVAMQDWVNYQLENYYREEFPKAARGSENSDATIPELLDSSDESRRAHGMAILRQWASLLLGPDADRVQWKRKVGHPKSPPQYFSEAPYKPKGLIRHDIEALYNYSSRVRMANLAVAIIHNFWRKSYDGKWKRRRGDIDAYKIAADYFVVDEEDVRRKPSGRRKKKRDI
jgi:hypothetical protein